MYGPVAFRPTGSSVLVAVGGMGELVMVYVAVGGMAVVLGLGVTSLVNPMVGAGWLTTNVDVEATLHEVRLSTASIKTSLRVIFGIVDNPLHIRQVSHQVNDHTIAFRLSKKLDLSVLVSTEIIVPTAHIE
jgi:hypothetical protein